MKNKLSLLLLISAFSLGLKANDSIRKRTVDFSLISNTYFLNNNSTNGNILSSPTTVLDFEAKLMFGKRKWKHVVFFSRDTYRYKLIYGFDYVVGTIYLGTKPQAVYGKFVDVDRIITTNYFNVGYGLSKTYKVNKMFSLLSNIEFCLLVRTIDNIKNIYLNSSEPIPNDALVKGRYINQNNFGRVALSYKLNGMYQVTTKISILAGINLTSSFGRSLYGGGYSSFDDQLFFTDKYQDSKQIRYRDSPTSTYQKLRTFASINIGVNFKIQ